LKKKRKKKKKKHQNHDAIIDVELASTSKTGDGVSADDYTQQLRKRLGHRSTFTNNVSSNSKTREPIVLAWNDIIFEVPSKKKTPKKTILKKVSGIVKPGQMLAIMGASGAGKTTLLNILASRIRDNVTGTIRINGADAMKNRKITKIISGYVMQDDTMLANLTVRETLMFSAMIRLPSSLSKEKKEERVRNIIEELGLTKVADNKIGSVQKRGLSGGERKRVNIGTELITDPSLLFLDEPTSGLDAFTSFSIIETLLSLAKAGRTIVTTIHQPRSNIFSLFDVLLLLSEGQVIYFGPAKDAVSYFSNLNYSCPTYVNPADYFLDISSSDGQEESKSISKFFVEGWNASSESKFQEKKVAEEMERPDQLILPFNGGFATGYLTQFGLLFQRSVKNYYRDKLLQFIKAFQTILFAIIVGLIYLKIGNDQTSIGDRAGALYFIITNQAFPNVTGALVAFLEEKDVFIRERSSRSYRTSPYYIAKSFSELPGQLIFPIVFSCISYWMIGLNPDPERFLVFIGIMLLLNFISVSLGIAISAGSPSITAANVLGPVILVIFMLFGGFFINLSSIPVYFIWLQYSSFIKYCFIALMRNEFEGLTFTCTSSQLIQPGNICPVTTGVEALQNYGMDSSDLTVTSCSLIILGMALFYRLLGYILLRQTTKKKANA